MILQIKVKPNSKEDKLEYTPEGLLTARIKAPPVDGKANAYLLKYLSKTFGIPKSCIEIVQGESSPLKRIELNCDEEQLREKLILIQKQ